MSGPDHFAKYRASLVSQKDRAPFGTTGGLPFLTCSRQAGAGAETVAHLLAEKLNADLTAGAQPWTVFEKNLMTKVLADADLPQEIAKLALEEKDTTVQAILGEVFGLHPSMWTPESTRLAHLEKHFHLPAKAAAKYLQEQDEGRRRYVKSNFQSEIDDPTRYHATLNPGLLSFGHTAGLVADLVADLDGE